jgi:hypothetical protein
MAKYGLWPCYERFVKAVINLALKDALGDIRKIDRRRKHGSTRLIAEARAFIKSAWCQELCSMTDMDYEQVRKYAKDSKEAKNAQ